MSTKNANQIEISYYRHKDILSIQILPIRPARTGNGKSDFLIRYDWDDPEKVVGFEILDFSTLIPKIYNKNIIPELPMLFSISGTEEDGLTLQEVLEWVYRNLILHQEVVPFVEGN